MTLTKSEKMARLIGHKVECAMCHVKKTFGNNWMETKQDKVLLICCPKCVKDNPIMGWCSI